MILYLDTSALVKLYVEEPESDIVRKLVSEAEEIVISEISIVEAMAAFARARREGRFRNADLLALPSSFYADLGKYNVLPFSGQWLTLLAGLLTERHSLRALDAIHLASALSFRGSESKEIVFSTWDKRLRDAAEAEGFRVVPEEAT